LSFAEEYKFEPSEIEKKPYHLGGFGEFRLVLNVLDNNAALYKTKFYNQNVGDTTKEYKVVLGIFPLTGMNWNITMYSYSYISFVPSSIMAD
jgi:hypothetical protein